MKVLQSLPTFFLKSSGPAVLVDIYSRELSQRGLSIEILTTDAFKEDKFLDDSICPIHVIRSFRFLQRKKVYLPCSFILPELEEILKDFDIIHLHEYRSVQNLIVAHVAEKLNIPYVVQAHGTLSLLSRNFFDKASKILYDNIFGKQFLYRAASVIAVTNFEIQQYLQMSIQKSKIHLVPNAIDYSLFEKLPSKGRFRDRLGIDNNAIVILFLSRLYWTKGPDLLVESFSSIASSFPETVLVMAGPDDGMKKELVKMRKEKNLEDRILFPGELRGSEKIQAFVDSDIFVLPSRYEIFGIVVLEAFACGLPVIASSTGGLKEIIKQNTTGFLFQSGNIEELTQKLKMLLMNHNLRQELGKNASNYVATHFSVETSSNRLQEIYNKIVEEGM